MSHKARVIGAIALAGSLMGFSWSDWWPPAFLQPWWPPALQQKIGELEAKVNAAETEKSALLKKVTEVSQAADDCKAQSRSEEHTSELQSPCNLVCRLLLEKKKKYRSRISRSLMYRLQTC